MTQPRNIIIWGAAILVGISMLVGIGLSLRADKATPASVVQEKMVDPLLYRDDMYGLSFRLAEGYSSSVTSDEAGRTVLISKAGEGVVGQLYIPIEGLSEALTPQLVQENFGANAVFDVKGFSLTNHPDVRGTTFSFQPATFRNSIEVWFVRTGTLYQFTMDYGERTVLFDMISTLQW